MATNKQHKDLFGGALLSAGISAAALASNPAPTQAQCNPQLGAFQDVWEITRSNFPDSYALNRITSVAMSTDRLYITVSPFFSDPGGPLTYRGQLLTWDTTNPAAPVLIGESVEFPEPLFELTSTNSPGTGSVIFGSTLIGIAPDGIRFFDVTDPNVPLLLNTLDLPGGEESIIEHNNLLYIRSGGSLYIVDPADSQAPAILDTEPIGFRWCAPSSNGVLPAVEGTTLTLFDVSDPTNITVLGTHPVDTALSVGIIGNTCVINRNNQSLLVDITDPASPVSLPLFLYPGSYRWFETRGSYGVGINSVSAPRMDVIDFSDPSAPFIDSSLSSFIRGDSSQTLRFAAGGGGVFAVTVGETNGDWAELRLLDLSSCVLPPSVLFSPASRIVNVGDPAETLTCITDAAFTHQWMLDGVPLTEGFPYAGTDTASLTIEPIVGVDGVYTCEVANADGTDLSLPTVFGLRASSGPECEGDANGDGVVDVNDISFVLFRLGNPCL